MDSRRQEGNGRARSPGPGRMSEKEIAGWFITFTDAEEKRIRTALESYGYDMTPDGIKAYVLDSLEALEEEAEEKRPSKAELLIDTAVKAVAENPQIVKTYASMAGNALLSAFMKKAAPR